MTTSDTMLPEVEISAQLIEWFKELTGYSFNDFLEYMNKNNLWSLLDDKELIKGCIWAEEEDIINIFGRFMTEDERLNIISRNNS